MIYNHSNPVLWGIIFFLFLLPHILLVVSELVLSRYRFEYVHMEICVVSNRSLTKFRKLAAKVVQRHTPTGRFSTIGVK